MGFPYSLDPAVASQGPSCQSHILPWRPPGGPYRSEQAGGRAQRPPDWVPMPMLPLVSHLVTSWACTTVDRPTTPGATKQSAGGELISLHQGFRGWEGLPENGPLAPFPQSPATFSWGWPGAARSSRREGPSQTILNSVPSPRATCPAREQN